MDFQRTGWSVAFKLLQSIKPADSPGGLFSPMANKWRMAFLTLFNLAFVALLAFVLSASANATPSAAATFLDTQMPDQAQSVTGTISAVGKNSFTLTLGSAMAQQEQTSARSMVFLVDKNTTIDGKLRVGASADVTYREENGHNVALSVRVAPQNAR